jgi:hypothetical protein
LFGKKFIFFSFNLYIHHVIIKNRIFKVFKAISFLAIAGGISSIAFPLTNCSKKRMVEPSITLAYSSSSFAFTQNSSSSIAAPTLVDNNQNAATATFSSFPALPNGLTFNTADGSVTGTPSSFQDSIKYTITATGTGD